MGSQPGGSTHSPTSDWIAVFAMIAGAGLIALSIIFDSMVLGIVGSVVAVGGAVGAWAMGIMSHTEDYTPTRDDA